jgi:hypothetical protein
MIVISYDGTEAMYNQIVAKKQAEGLTLTDVSNIKEGNFLGFMVFPDLNYIKEQGREEIKSLIRKSSNLIELKTEIEEEVIK